MLPATLNCTKHHKRPSHATCSLSFLAVVEGEDWSSATCTVLFSTLQTRKTIP